MKKYFKILLNVIIINLLFINSINSKTLPPGTGGAADVPANVLILLDVSGSMGWDIQEGLNYGNDVQAVAPITNSGSVLTYTRNTLRQTDQAGNAQENIHPNRRELTHNRNNFGLGDNRKKVVYYDNQIFTYDNRRDRLYRYEYANNNIQSVEFMINQNFSQMFLSGDNLILMSQNGGSYRVKDLTALNVNATQCNMARNSTLDRIQRLNSNAQNPTFTFNVDASGNLIAFGQERNNPVRLYKFASAGTCFNDEPNETFERNNNNNFNQPSSIVGHPTNENIFFVTDAGRHNLQRITVANTAITINETVGRFGGINANYNPTNKNNIRFNQPVHIAIESSTSTIYVADQRNRAVQSFDFDLDFQNVTGFRSTMSRLEGARRAIRSVVTDSSLIASVNFGYGIWSDYNVWWSQWGRFCRFGHCSMPRTTAMIRHGLDWLGQYWWIREVLLHSDIFGLGPDRFPGFENWDNGRMEGIPCSPLGCIEVLADRNGAALTNARIADAQPMYGTNANFFATLAEDYFNHPTLSPIDPNSDCQDNYIIVVGDGDFTSGVDLGLNRIATLANRQNSPVQTIPIAYGPGITANGLAQFDRLAERGGTGNAVIAESPAQLRARLADIIRNIQADKLAFTAPAITSKVGEGGFLYQAQFQYRQNKEWIGSLSATAITDEGTLAQDFSWEAARNLPLPNSRNIWTVIPGVDYMGNWNNFTEDNSILINEQFRSLGNEVGDYHNDTPTSAANVGTARCSNSGDSIASIQNGNTDDIRGLISFIRGEDYFDYDSDCLLNEPRLDDNGLRGYLGDIYHSELVVVGPPNANTNFIQKNEEAYFRSVNNYQAFKDANKNRTKTIYVGSNNGILHAFNAETGQELWGFVPPLLIGKLPLVVNPGLNNRNPQGDRGGSSAIYAVDGSPVVHDMYMTHPVFGGVNWYTIMMVPFGRGGAGYSVLDVTNPIAPVHLYSIYNDSVNNEVLRMNHLGVINRFDYVDETYSWLDLDEVNTVRDNYQADNNVNSTCNDTLATSCYRGRNFNLPVSGLTRDDITIFLDRRITTAYQVSQNGGNTLISFNAPQTYNGDTSGQSQNPSNLNLSIEISPDAVARLSTNLPARYNYTKLGETWSSPRIFRMPVSSNRDIYAAVMGAGYGASSRTVGSGVFVINMSDILSEPGQIERKIDIPDVGNFNGDIINSVVATPVVITADQTTGVNYKGALVYVNDLEGKITKINLTDMTESNTGERIELYDSTEIFRSISNATNGRYMFHSMDTAIGTTSKNLWLYAGTGDYERVTTRNSNVDNLLIGFRDKNFPYYKNVNNVVSAQMLTACQDTSNDSTGVNCPLDSDDRVLIPGGNAEGVTVRDWGWYIKLENSSKVVAEPTVTRGVAYFPIYEPTSSQNQCEAGSAYVCAVDDECGTNFSGRLGTNTGANRTKQCFFVGTGVLSKLVVFGNKLFANIAGASTQEKTDLVQLEGIQEDVEALRSSWREGNF
jgi:type IV pilus assembly protein PilY1